MSDSNRGLMDIVEPVAPIVVADNTWLFVAILSVVLILLAGGIFFWWKFKLPALRTLNALRILQQKLHLKELTPHESMLMLALDLRHGLGVKRLRADQLPQQIKAKDHGRWVEFMQHLDVMLYQKETELNEEKIVALFEQAKYWLRRYSRRSTLKKLGA